LDALAPESTFPREGLEQWRLREDHLGRGLCLRGCCKRLADSLVGRIILPHSQRLDQRQRKVKDNDVPFKRMVTIQSLVEEAGYP
jgi:hypothetical protein